MDAPLLLHDLLYIDIFSGLACSVGLEELMLFTPLTLHSNVIVDNNTIIEHEQMPIV